MYSFGNKSLENEAMSLRHSAGAPAHTQPSRPIRVVVRPYDISVHAHEFKKQLLSVFNRAETVFKEYRRYTVAVLIAVF